MKLNILILHKLGDPSISRVFLKKLVFFLREHSPEHNYLYHDVSFSFPESLRGIKFDAIVLDVTMLAQRWGRGDKFRKLKRDYQFVAESTALKIAFPQDDYDCHVLLDEWMIEWNVDVVFSVISSNWETLYPQFSRKGSIKLAYTGYLDDQLIRFPTQAFHSRSIDLGYRAKKLLPYFGKLGETKWKIGLEVLEKIKGLDFKEDIKIGDEHLVLGQDWYRFINDCKFTLGSNSGSSLLDPYGSIRKKVQRYLRSNPSAPFAEVEKACFPGMDGKESFTAISPRVLEAAVLNSCQILVEGEYSKVLQPWEHYIPIKPDASDFDQVHAAMKEEDEVRSRIRRCREAILDCSFLRYSSKAEKVLGLIFEKLDAESGESPQPGVEDLLSRHELELRRTTSLIFGAKRLRARVSGIPLVGLLAKVFICSFTLGLATRTLRILGFRFAPP
ncbi:MAG TPA: hypothetical protein DCX67_06775 [Opitutae bacterium]|nr:hypothetical protein [Opitutae bacterium]